MISVMIISSLDSIHKHRIFSIIILICRHWLYISSSSGLCSWTLPVHRHSICLPLLSRPSTNELVHLELTVFIFCFFFASRFRIHALLNWVIYILWPNWTRLQSMFISIHVVPHSIQISWHYGSARTSYCNGTQHRFSSFNCPVQGYSWWDGDRIRIRNTCPL